MNIKLAGQYENEFSSFFNSHGAFSFWKGRVALYAILKALSIGTDDEIILPGYTCVMNVNPIKYLGAKSVYVDIEPDTFNINPDLIEEKITEKTKIILAQHTYGYPCDMDRIIEIAKRHNIQVIEDCCLSMGSAYKGKKTGTMGKAAYFSFQWNKPYTTGLGGMAMTNDEDMAKNISSLKENEAVLPSFKDTFMLWAQLMIYRSFIYPNTTALAQRLFRWLTKKGLVLGSSSTAEFNPQMPSDFFKAAGSVQIKSGKRQLRKLDNNIQHRKKIAAIYDDLLSQKGWSPRNYDSNVMDPVMVRYPVRIKQKQQALDQASSAGIELGSWFECPLHPQETSLKLYGYETGMCPEAEKASREVVNLPLHPRVNEKTVVKTVNFITNFTQA